MLALRLRIRLRGNGGGSYFGPMARVPARFRGCFRRNSVCLFEFSSSHSVPACFRRNREASQTEHHGFANDVIGRGEWIRTTDPSVPNRVLYQAEPRPDTGEKSTANRLRRPGTVTPNNHSTSIDRSHQLNLNRSRQLREWRVAGGADLPAPALKRRELTGYCCVPPDFPFRCLSRNVSIAV